MLSRLICLYFIFLPFQFALSPMEGVDLPIIRIMGVLLVGVWLGESLRRRELLLPRPMEMFALSLFLGVTGISFLWAVEPTWALRKWIFLASFFPLAIVFFSEIRKTGAQKMAEAYSIGAAGAALIALVQFFSQFFFGANAVFEALLLKVYPFFLGEAFARSVAEHPSLFVEISGQPLLRAVGLFPDPHVAAYFFGMALPFVVGMFVRETSKEKRKWILAAGVILLCADLLTFSRGGYIGLIAGAIAYLPFLFQKKESVMKKRGSFLVVLGIGCIVAVGLMDNPIRSRFIESFRAEEGSNHARIILWKEATGAISRAPWIGYGLGNYSLEVLPSAKYRDPIYAHNLYLDIWVEGGILSLIAFVSMTAGQMVIFIKKTARGAIGSVWGHAGYASLAVYLGHSVFENVLFSVHILPVLLFVLAVLWWEKELLCRNNTNKSL